MSVESWDRDEIKKLALASGKPLEVECAVAFLKAKWNVRLGTYYNDILSEKVRELDVYIERREEIKVGAKRCTLRLRILGSCKGFPLDQGPATYSISAESGSLHKPSFPCFSIAASSISEQSATAFLHHAGLSAARQVIGFDILRRDNTKRQPQPEYSRIGDRDLYDGLDSALKAAVFFYHDDRNRYEFPYSQVPGYVGLNIPLLVTSRPFWDVSVEGGILGEPEIRYCAHHVGLYPFAGREKRFEPIMSILWHAAKIGELTSVLDYLFAMLVDEIKLKLDKR